ncbi:MAG TPA: sulfate ABC transporter permease subunit [Polyangiales bacterium]|nr:sulfate ABC transporter permease subunit [Polyangiales bacterium]
MKQVAYALLPTRSERVARGAVVTYIALLVALPLLALVTFGLSDGLTTLVAALRSPVARSALWLTLWTSVLVGAFDIVLGVATAWVLVRYEFPGRAALSALVDLPLAIPTLVAGMMLATLYGANSFIGHTFQALGFQVIFAPAGIVLALLFVTLPFVIRAVEPVLQEIDPAEEEAATILGAGPFRTFRTVFFPAILPAALSAGIRSIGRALGEFGSIVVVAGNIPFRTLTAPVFIFGEIESGTPRTAAAVSVLLLGIALALHAVASAIESRTGARHV